MDTGHRFRPWTVGTECRILIIVLGKVLWGDMKDSQLSTIDRSAPRWLSRLVLLLGAATLLGLLFGSRTFVLYSFYPDRRTTLAEALLPSLTDWYLWALLAPALFWLVRRWPLEADRWSRALVIHVVAGAGIATIKWSLDLGVTRLAEWTSPMPVALPAFIFHFYANFITYWVIVAVAHAIDYGRRYRERQLRASRLEARLAQVQLEVLRMKLQPHFLFNTLHAISTLMHRDADAADRMLAQLGDLLRLTIERIGVHEVALKEELEFLRSYLEIEQTRFEDRLRVIIDAEPETLDAYVPNLILQPLVENSIRHGIAPRATPGNVEVRAERADGRLRLIVRDDGPGLSGDSGTVREGLGLTNVRARLRQLYGAEQELRLANRPEGGLEVTLLIPFDERPRASAPVEIER